MGKNELLEKLKGSGVTIVADADENAGIFECVPHYRNNYGFHHIFHSGSEAVLLKGVYKDFVRIVKGNGLSESDANGLAKILNDAETSAGVPLKTTVIKTQSGFALLDAAETALPRRTWGDLRDYRIPRPLTPLEYAVPASRLYDEDVMLSSGTGGSLFPGVMSKFAESVLEKIPDVLNPLFISCNLKTLSPTAVPAYGRIFVNCASFEKNLKAAGVGNSFFRASFSPALYVKNPGKPGRVNRSYFPITFEETAELLDDVKRTIPHITISSIGEDSFFEYPVKLAIVAEYLLIMLNDRLAGLTDYFGSVSSCLEAIFKTREKSLFYNTEPLSLPLFIDFSSPFEETVFGCAKRAEGIDFYVKKLPFFKRAGSAGKIEKAIAAVHRLLNLRDETYLAVCSFLGKSREVLSQLASFGIQKGRLKNMEDISMLEHSEVKRLAFDSLYGDMSASVNFRKWFSWRCAAQVVPPEIYGRDLENCAKISETMIIKSLDLAEFSALSFFHRDMRSTVTGNMELEDYSERILASGFIPVPCLPRFKNAAAFVLEKMPLFGFTAEYACLNDIPVYTGVRFAPLVLDGVAIATEKDKIRKI